MVPGLPDHPAACRNGLGLSATQWNAQRDPRGQLLGSVDSTRVLALALAGGRVGRFRIAGTAGVDMTRVGRVRATDAYWCKVSEGEPTVFDAARACDAADVLDAAPAAQLGLTVGATVDMWLTGPFWAHTALGSTLYVAPLDGGRAFDTPAWLDAGVTYRF